MMPHPHKHPEPVANSYKALALESTLYGLALLVAFGLTVSGWMHNLRGTSDYGTGQAVQTQAPVHPAMGTPAPVARN